MENVAGVILAGGLSRRMKGPEKSHVLLHEKSLLHHVVDRITPQAAPLVLNANGDPDRFATFHLPVVCDDVPDHPGPLAGLMAGMGWIQKNAPHIEWMVSVPCDTPVLPSDLCKRFLEAVTDQKADIAMAGSDGRLHPVIGLWRVCLLEDLRKAVVEKDIRKVRAFSDRYPTAHVHWPLEPLDPFGNINTPEELEAAQSWL